MKWLKLMVNQFHALNIWGGFNMETAAMDLQYTTPEWQVFEQITTNKRMKIIAIEGLDKSGKHTQSKLLAEYLKTLGYNVVQSEFHRYDTPTGELIMKWLTKQWGVDQKTIELIMTADKQAQQQWFNQLEAEGVDFLILDRYITSQQVYAEANGIDPYWTNELQKYMRKPDIEIFIDIPAEESMRRKGKHNNGENDRYESDLELLNRVRQLYLKRDMIKIDGVQSVDEVHFDIIYWVRRLLLEC
jgi:dTMP kinase